MTTPEIPDPATLARWRELCEQATPGPWEVQRRWSNECEIVPRITCKPDDDRGCGWIADCVGAPYLGHKSTLPNAAFIAESRTAVPALLAALERLTGERDAARAEADEAKRLLKPFADHAKRLNAARPESGKRCGPPATPPSPSGTGCGRG